MADNIHPIFDRIMNREEKENTLGQHARVLWLTGLSCSGKSTLAIQLEAELHQMGFFCKLLDGDNIRTGLCKNLEFSEEDRMENVRRIAEVSRLFAQSGIITINSFVSPLHSMRNMARDIIGVDDFFEIYVNCPLEVCEARDVKGLYKKARKGELKGFTGIDAPFEPPENPNVEVHTDMQDVETCVNIILAELLPQIIFQPKKIEE